MDIFRDVDIKHRHSGTAKMSAYVEAFIKGVSETLGIPREVLEKKIGHNKETKMKIEKGMKFLTTIRGRKSWFISPARRRGPTAWMLLDERITTSEFIFEVIEPQVLLIDGDYGVMGVLKSPDQKEFITVLNPECLGEAVKYGDIVVLETAENHKYSMEKFHNRNMAIPYRPKNMATPVREMSAEDWATKEYMYKKTTPYRERMPLKDHVVIEYRQSVNNPEKKIEVARWLKCPMCGEPHSMIGIYRDCVCGVRIHVNGARLEVEFKKE